MSRLWSWIENLEAALYASLLAMSTVGPAFVTLSDIISDMDGTDLGRDLGVSRRSACHLCHRVN
jgi:hypothetical protein